MRVRPPGSLRLRITLITTTVVAVFLVPASLLLIGWLRTTQLDDTDRLLNDQIDGVAVLLQRGLLPVNIPPTGLSTAVQVVEPNGATAAKTFGLNVELTVVDRPEVNRERRAIVPSSRLGVDDTSRYRVVARTVQYDIGSVTIYAATTLGPADAVVRKLAIALWMAVPALVALAAAMTWFLTGRALLPVERMRREVDAIRVAGTDQRLETRQRAAELDRLAVTLNEMLDRTSASEAIRRQFLADASHELRSPLAAARAMIEVGLAYPDHADWPATAADALVEVERLETLAAELLSLARAEGGERALRLETLDLAELVAAEVQRTPDDRVSIFSSSPAPVRVDRTLMVRAVRNLLDNARRHANHKVTLSIAGGAKASLQVHNDGDEIAPDQRERIFEPFTRLDGARDRDEGGAGLGLSLARRITEVHGGTLGVVDTTNGTAFLLTLPAAGQEADELSES